MEDALIGTRINRYEVRGLIYKSDLLGVYKAFDTKLERNVLMKVILHAADYSKESIDYFLAESRSLAKLSHPNISQVLDFGHENENLYLISEYATGQLLSELMTGPMPWRQAVDILLPLTEALAYAHSKGVIHRDLKPANILINSEGQPVLSDFSLVRIIESEETRDMTGTMVGLGSAGYISPEQGKGLPADFRSDIYSLGVIFFEMITGRKMFDAASSMEIVIQHVMADPPKPRSVIPDLPKEVEDSILTALSKDVNKRYQSMEAFDEALRSIQQSDLYRGQRVSKRLGANAVWIGGAVLGLGLIAAGALFASGVLPVTTAPTSTPVITTPLASPRPPSSTPQPTATKGIKLTPTLAATSTPRDETILSLPALPALPGTSLPAGNAIIGTQNIETLIELARWGIPDIRQFAFVHNNEILLAATSAGVYYYDPTELTPRHFFDTHGTLTTFAISADQNWVATGDVNGNVVIWDIRSGKELFRFGEQARTIRSIDFSPDKTKVVFSDTDRTIRIWTLDTGTVIVCEKKHGLPITKVLFTPNGEAVVSGGEDFLVYVWDIRNGKALRSLKASQKINDLSLSSDGKTLAAALDFALVEIFDFKTGKVSATLKSQGIIEDFTFVKFLPNNEVVLTASNDGYVRLWSATSAGILWQAVSKNQDGTPARRSPIKTLAVSASGTKCAVMYENGRVEIWNLSAQTMEVSKVIDHNEIKRVVISPNDRMVAFQGGNLFVEIVSLLNDKQRSQITGTLPRGIPISPNNALILIRSNDLHLYSLSPTAPTHLFEYFEVPVNGAVNYSSDSAIAIAAGSGIIKFWSTVSGRELISQDLPSRKGSFCQVIKRQTGVFLAAGSPNGVILSDKNLDYFCQAGRGPRTIAEDFLSDGSIIALALENKLVEVWNQQAGAQKQTLTSQTPGHILSVAVSYDGKLLAAASAGGTIEIYTLATMQPIKTLDMHTGPINQVLFSHDGRYLIAGLSDGTLRFLGINP